MPHPRPLIPDDAEAYSALRREMLLDSPWAFGASPEDDRPVEAVRRGLTEPCNSILAVIGENDGEAGRLLAAAGVRREEKRKRRHIAYIWGVYVTPSARGRGLGRLVVGAAIDTARGWEGVSAVQLAVSENAPAARRVYESLGFRRWGYEPDALRIDGRPFGEIHMHLPL